jgi:hypothetical protein
MKWRLFAYSITSSARASSVAIAAGQPVHRSPSAPPAAVLGARIEAKVSRAA